MVVGFVCFEQYGSVNVINKVSKGLPGSPGVRTVAGEALSGGLRKKVL